MSDLPSQRGLFFLMVVMCWSCFPGDVIVSHFPSLVTLVQLNPWGLVLRQALASWPRGWSVGESARMAAREREGLLAG